MRNTPVRMLMVGAGFMARTHLTAAARLNSVSFVGVLGRTPGRTRATARAFHLPAFTQLKEAVDATRPDAVDLCVPTRLHPELAEAAGALGLDVLCEKPLALSVEAGRRMARTADRQGVRLMVAHVLRFWPEYAWAADAVRTRRFGPARAVDCRRLSAPPPWNTWMLRESESGGAVLDLQVHDMDFVLQILGPPELVCAAGSEQAGGINSVCSRLRYADDRVANVQASFVMPRSHRFRMTFSVTCDRAVLDMDSWRDPGDRLRVFPSHGRPFSPSLPTSDAYGAQIDYFARQTRSNRPFARAPLTAALSALALCEASRLSCRRRAPVAFACP